VRRVAAVYQGDLFETLPLPALGTVAILRLEDWQRITDCAGTGVVAPASPPASPPKSRHPGGLTTHAALRSLVEEWLRGQGQASSYGADTRRDAQGCVTRTTAEAVAAAIDFVPPRLTGHGRVEAAGLAMASLGWNRNYLTVSDPDQPRRRKRFYSAPPGWLSV